MSLNLAVYASPLRAISMPTGVGQHIAQMVEHLAKIDMVEPKLLATRRDYAVVKPYLSETLAGLPVSYLPRAERLCRTMLLSTNWVSVERWCGEVDWVYSPKEQPVKTRNARLAVTVHDVLAFEEGIEVLAGRISRRSRMRWKLIMDRVLQRADLIATVSEFTKRRLIELFDLSDSGRIVVVGNGIADCYFQGRKGDDLEMLDAFGLKPDGFLITVGSLTYRKGGDLLLDLAKRMYDEKEGLRIVVTGRRHDADLMARYEVMKKEAPSLPLDLVGYVSNDEQAVLLRNALALVFPSRYEGFGIPILEAMAAGTPVVCSGEAAIPEVAGEAAIHVSGFTVDEWEPVLGGLSNGSSAREDMVSLGCARAREFTWGRCARRLVDAMGQA